MKSSKFPLKTKCIPVILVLFGSSLVNGGTLGRPLSPVKVLAAAGIDEPVDKLRYYTFSEEDIRERNRNLVGSNRPSSHQQNSYASKDPFEIPSLSAIALMMRRGETNPSEEDYRGGRYNDRDKPEHRRGNDNPDTGWGWPRPRPGSGSEEKDRDGWSPSTSTWAPPPRPPPPTSSPTSGWGWDKGAREDEDSSFPPPRPSYGKGSFTPVQNKDVQWQGSSSREGWGPPTTERGDGWGPPTTERPRYTPKYLASDEDKYKPIRYPPGVSGSGGGGGGWNGRESDRGRPPPLDGPGGVYLPPQRDPPLKDPPKWPGHSSDRDRDRDYDRDNDRGRPPGRESWGPSKWETERPRPQPPPSRGWESDRRPEPVAPRPQPSWSGHHGTESSHGRGWDKPNKGPPRPPPTTPGWGWDRDSSQRERPRPQRPNPFEYKEGLDDLSKHISSPIDTYERDEYPPGISRDRPAPSKYDNSLEDDSLPRAPNHYRIVAYTPSPEEIDQILAAKKAGPISKTYLPPHRGGEREDERRPGWSSSKGGRSNFNNQQVEEDDKGVQDKEKWYQETFQKLNNNLHPPAKTSLLPPPKSSKKSDQEQSNKPKSPLPAPDILSLDSNNGDSGKSTPKQTRYDAQGFKYIPYDHPGAKKQLPSSPPRDIYSNLEYREGREPTEVKAKGRVESIKKEKQLSEPSSLSARSLQGSESRNSFVRRTFNSSRTRSHISLWKSETTTLTTTPSPPTEEVEVATTTKSPRLIRPTPRRSPLIPKRLTTETTQKSVIVEMEDFGRKINIIRNRLKKVEGTGSKPVSAPFGFAFRGKGREKEKEREPLLEGPTSLIGKLVIK